MKEFKIPKLTAEEIETLQVDAAQRMLGKLQGLIVDITDELLVARGEEVKARNDVSALKDLLRSAKSSASILQSICKRV